MSWKTVVVKETNRLFLKNNQLAFVDNDQVKTLSLEDIDAVVFDNNRSVITTQLLSKLADHNVFVMVCDQKHDPNGVFLPFNQHWKPLSIFNLQVKAKLPLKKQLWARIIRSQILNSAIVLKKLNYLPAEVEKMRLYADKILSYDKDNREATAVSLFYQNLYGSGFVRYKDSGISSAIDYGSKIVASAITRSLVKYGFFTNLGIKHCAETNAFNLTYDLIEPFRPAIHYFIKLMGETIGDSLLYNQRLQLVELLQYRLTINKELTTLSNAIDIMVKSLITALKNEDSNKLLLPQIPLDDDQYYEQTIS